MVSALATCYTEIGQVIIFVQASFLKVVECVDEQRSLVEVIKFRREPPLINLPSDWEFLIRPTACLDAFDSIDHNEDQVNGEGLSSNFGTVVEARSSWGDWGFL